MTTIEIHILPEDVVEVSSLLQTKRGEVTLTQSSGMDGAQVASLLVTLTPEILGTIVAIYVAKKRADKFVKLKYKGVEIQGVSEARLEAMLKEILEHEIKS